MLIDWLWALAITLGLWLEVGGFTRLITTYLVPKLSRQKIAPELALALGFAVTAQGYFIASLVGGLTARTHLLVLLAGCAALVLVPRPEKSAHDRFRMARYLSPLSWKRAAPWLVWPALWTLLKLTDAIVPHNQPAPLAIHLYGPHRWLEEGTQQIDPLNPITALASVWDALYYHLQTLCELGAPVHRVALVRAQMAAQLVHFTAGQWLAIALLARLLAPFIRAGWNVLVHETSEGQAPEARRHQLGMAAVVALPSSLFFAWLACAPLSLTSTQALSDWGAAALFFAALSFLVQRRMSLGWFLWATAAAAQGSIVYTIAGAIAATVLALWREQRHVVLSALRSSLLGLCLGLAPWLWRNVTQTGRLFYPFVDHAGGSPGWIPNAPPLNTFHAEWGLPLKLLIAAGLVALAVYFGRLRFRVRDRAMATLLIFMLAGSVPALITNGFVLELAIVLVATAALGIEFLLSSRLRAWVPYFWMAIGLACVPLPVHLVWQNLPLAFTPADNYLTQYDNHFEAKVWSSVHLPADAQIAWTADDEFYYLEQRAASIPGSTLLHDALAHASTPNGRAQALCELGFTVLAWEERAHGPEVAGLATWLKLTRTSILHSSDDVTFFDLTCQRH